MNAKQTAPLLVTLAPLIAAAPPLIIGGAIGLGIVYLLKALFSDGKEAQPEASVEASTEARKPAETTAFRQIPAEIPGNRPIGLLTSVPRVVVPPASIPTVPVVSAPVPAPACPSKRKIVGRQDMAAVFQNGGRTFCRTDAVVALKNLGFGKTAAYAALAPDGRFSAWLQCAPDGIITWTDGQGT